MQDLQFKLVTITPKIAEELISTNIWNNRNIIKSNVISLANQMSNGLWQSHTGETIKISNTGKIIDGNNRLHAVVRSGVTIQVYLASNIPEEAIMVLDTGAKRTIADALTIRGIQNAQIKAASIQIYTNLKSGYTSSLSSPNGTDVTGHNQLRSIARTNGRLSADQILEIYMERQNLWDEFTTKFMATCRIVDTSANIAAMWAYLHDYSESGAYEFIHRLVTGENLESDSPILILRNRLIQAKTSKVYSLTATERYIAYITCWNKFRKNGKMKRLKINLDNPIESVSK